MLYYFFTTMGWMPLSRLMTYYSFRGIVALGLSLIASIYFGGVFISYLTKHHISETQRDSAIDPFNVSKKNIPTMGGLVILFSILAVNLLIGNLSNIYMLLLLTVTLLLGVLGFADDYIKTFKKNKDGLSPLVKIAGQIIVGLIIGLTLRYSPQCVMNETVSLRYENNTVVVDKSPEVKSTRTTIPFFKHHNCNYADIFRFMGECNMYKMGWVFFVMLTVIIIMSVSNGSNLNDGMDGMCAGNCTLMGIGLLVLIYFSGNVRYADYFDIMYIAGCSELAVFMSSFIGALIGFLWWNGYPAQVFMGDTGSLTIGGIIGAVAVIIHKELLLPILCFSFLIESASVILQTSCYKYFKKKGIHFRIWRRTPIHDHFRTSVEMVHKVDPACHVFFKGSSFLHFETKVVLRFWIITLMSVILTILTLKIR